jgi:ribonuclease Z
MPSYTNMLIQHLVASREHGADPVTFTSASLNQLRLNQLDSEIFPIPNLKLEAKKDISCESTTNI